MTQELHVSGQWVILRCANATTLKLAESLNAHGITAWAPAEKIVRRKGESRKRRKDIRPVLPSFVFAARDRLNDLLALMQSLASPHPGFWVMRHYDRIPIIADRALDPLRVAERKAQPREEAKRWNPGEAVRATTGGFEGLTGRIERTRGKKAFVTFPGFSTPIEIEALFLLPDVAKDDLPLPRQAA